MSQQFPSQLEGDNHILHICTFGILGSLITVALCRSSVHFRCCPNNMIRLITEKLLFTKDSLLFHAHYH